MVSGWCLLFSCAQAHLQHLMAIFPGKYGLAGYHLDFFSVSNYPYPEHPHRTGQNSLRTHRVLWSVPCPLTLITIARGFEAEVLMGLMPFLLPNQQCQSTEALLLCCAGIWNCTYVVVWIAHGGLLGTVWQCWLWHANHLSDDTRSTFSANFLDKLSRI